MSTTSTCVSKLIAIGVTLLVGTSMLEGCSDSDSEVPAPRTRKRGSDILGCDIYLGEKSPFTVATYESSGSGNFTLLYRECTELQNASLAGPPTCKVTLTSASDPPQKVDMQYEDPNVFVAAATTCPDGSTAPLPAGVNVRNPPCRGSAASRPSERIVYDSVINFLFTEMVMCRDETLPFARREDTMSLDTIKPKDVPRGRILYVKDTDASLTTIDIDKCKPTYYWLDYLRKPEFSLKCDVPGMRSKSYYPPVVNRPRDLSLTTQDIEWAQPKITRFRTNRVLDPLNPMYKLPKSEAVPVEPPRFNGRLTNDIRGRTAKDINAGPLDGRLPAMRGTDPLEPTYVIPINPVLSRGRLPPATSLNHIWSEEVRSVENPKMEPMVIGEVPLSRPRKLQWDNGEPLFSLLKEDIAGASSQRHVGSIPFNIYEQPVEERPDFHSTADIPGAQVNSLAKGIVTRRKLDPQNPKYTFLDGTRGVVPRRVSINSYGALGHEAARPATEVVSEAERGLPPAAPRPAKNGNFECESEVPGPARTPVKVPDVVLPVKVPPRETVAKDRITAISPERRQTPTAQQNEVPSARHSVVTASTPGMTPAQRLDQFITPGPTARSSPPPV
ncbi:hypothetical protein FOZ61_000688 [Perkinsus olseni]|uniref:Uncharacterized protein n=1 Tax=Perkinsus olseni TaxID=32597 RepID=A0A7J6KT86_PEROL|nr:hypothetical protein FOZ61_000688 [Perkinsus olseni]